jgi:hypothetical protein
VTKKLGNDYRWWIESVTPGTYNQVLGQMSTTVDESGSTIDTSTKDDFPYGTAAPGLRNVSVSVDMIPNLPDATGFTRFETLATATTATAVLIQIRKGGATGAHPADTVFAGSFYITSFNKSFGQNDAVKATATLVSAAAPTTNLLA